MVRADQQSLTAVALFNGHLRFRNVRRGYFQQSDDLNWLVVGGYGADTSCVPRQVWARSTAMKDGVVFLALLHM